MAKFIDITTHGGSRDGGQDGSPSKAVVREYLMDMHHMCLGMKDLEAAMPTLYLMEKCLRKNGIRDPELLSLPSLVEDCFRKKNEPQPSTNNVGCNFFRPVRLKAPIKLPSDSLFSAQSSILPFLR